MGISKAIRIQVWKKYDCHCAYCGNPLSYEKMQVDHLFPKRMRWAWKNKEYAKKRNWVLPPHIDHIDNLMPSCGRCNHYKRALFLENFRFLLLRLHQRILALYISKVAIDYKLIKIKPWDGIFYFEKFPKRTKIVK